jgi:hypothetical protein
MKTTKAAACWLRSLVRMTEVLTPPVSNSSSDRPTEVAPYPVEYRYTPLAALPFIAFGIAIVFCGLLALRFSISTLMTDKAGDFMSAARLAMICIPFIGLGLWFIISPLVYRLIVSADFIEERYPFGNNRFSRAAIAGKRTYPRGAMVLVRTVVIYPVDRAALPMKLEIHFKNTRALDAWLLSIPDLQASPNEWRKHIKIQRKFQLMMLAFSFGLPSIYLLALLVRRRLHF